MADFNVRADGVDVEQIMRQIRSRIRDKRGVDYTEDQIQELAKVKLEKFLDPKGVRSDLLEQFRRMPSDIPPTYAFDDQTLFQSDKAVIRFFRRLFRPVLKLLFNPNPLIQVMDQQVAINRFLMDRTARDVLFYEVVHNLVVEVTRATIEVKNMKMRVESIASRLEFNERRARALEAVVQYRPEGERGGRPQERDRDRDRERGREPGREPMRRGPADGGTAHRVVHSRAHQAPEAAAGDAHPNPPDPVTGGESLRSRRKRRRRGRRSGPGFAEGAATPGEGASAGPGQGTANETDREGTSGNAGEEMSVGGFDERIPAEDSPAERSPADSSDGRSDKDSFES